MRTDEIKKLMPIQQELPQSIPETYVETAEFDIFHDEGIAYTKELEAAGARVEINETAGTFHGYDTAINTKIVRSNIGNRIAFLRKLFN